MKESIIHYCYTAMTRITFKAVTNKNAKNQQKTQESPSFSISSVDAINHKINVHAYTHIQSQPCIQGSLGISYQNYS